MKRFLSKHSPLLIFAALFVVFAFISPYFATTGNLQSVAQRTSEIAIMSVGEVMVILTAGIDLSVGRVAALSGTVCAWSMKAMAGALGENYPFLIPFVVLLGMLFGTLTGAFCGMINGLLVSKGRIPPFIATLGMMMMAYGATLLISGGKSISGMPESFQWLGGAKILSAGTTAWWVPVVIMILVVIFFSILLSMTAFGRAIYAIGGNQQAARLSGIPVDKILTRAYMLSGTLAGFAGVMLTSRMTMADANSTEMWELFAIAACVIGGASLMGGEGGAIGCLAGALIMGVLYNICNLENINVYWQQIIIGALVISLVLYDTFRKRRAGLLKT